MHQHRERLQVAPGQFQFAAERLVHGDAVAGAGQGVAQGGLDRGAIEQGVAQREQQGAEQALQLPLFVFAEALATTEDQFAEVVAIVAQAIAHRMLGAAAELQAQVGARMAIAKGVQRDQLADFLEEQAENPLCLQAALQLLGQLLAQLHQVAGARPAGVTAGLGAALLLGGVEIDGIGLFGRSHARDLWRERRRQ